MLDNLLELSVPPSLVGIHQLPVEILVDIFASVDAVDSWGRLGTAHGRGIAKLMLVCRDWRDVAISTPEFWRRVDTAEPPETVSLRLQRSRGSTIDVRIFYPWIRKYKPLWQEAIPLILPHAHRIRSLYINLHMVHYPEVHSLLEGEMHALESLDIVPVRDFREKGLDRDFSTCSPSRRNYPRLRSLTSQRLYMPTPADFWRTLRTLKMEEFPRTASRNYLMRDVFAILKANPALEELILWWHMGAPKAPPDVQQDQPGSRHPGQRQVIALRHLRHFSLHGTIPCVMELLDRLTLPEDIPYVDIRTCVTSAYAERPPTNEIAHKFVALIPTHLRFLQDRMSAVSFTTSDFHTICTPPYAPADAELSQERTAISFERSIGYPVPPNMSPGMRCLLGVLGWVPVRRLSMSPPPHFTEEDSYERMFDTFPSLEELEVSGFEMAIKAVMFNALTPVLRENGEREIPRCPHLRVIAVHTRLRPGPHKQAPLLTQAMEACLRARAEAGVRLHRALLHLWFGRIDDEDDDQDCLDTIEEIRGLADEVEYKYRHGARVCRRCSSAYSY